MIHPLKQSLDSLKKQLTESEKVAYKKLAEIPFVIRSVGKSFIDEIVEVLEAENVKVWTKIALLEMDITLFLGGRD